MGFNKCYLQKSHVKYLYETGGIKAITDMLVVYDTFSTQDCFFLLNFTSINEIKKAEPEIKVWLYTTDNDNK